MGRKHGSVTPDATCTSNIEGGLVFGGRPLFSAIFHSLSPQRARALLSKARDSLVDGGLVVVHEGLVNDDKVSPVSAVFFSLNMLVNVGEGRSYSAREIMFWLTDTGFVSPRLQHLPPSAGTSLVLGTKP